MQFMVIETFRNQDAKSVYRRFREKGRLLPDGLTFVSSWVEADLRRCFQVMECNDVTVLQQWVAEWSDLIDFEIVPVVSGKATAEAFASGSSNSQSAAEPKARGQGHATSGRHRRRLG